MKRPPKYKRGDIVYRKPYGDARFDVRNWQSYILQGKHIIASNAPVYNPHDDGTACYMYCTQSEFGERVVENECSLVDWPYKPDLDTDW